MISTVLMALAMAQAAPVAPVVATPPTESPAVAARRDKALRLARVLASDQFVVEAGDDAYIKLTRDAMLASPDVQAMEKQHPGVVDAMVRASLPVTKVQLRRRLPQLWDKLADFYLANFTPLELDQALTFYASPTGQKMIAQLIARIRPNAVAAELKKNPTGGVSAGALRSDVQATVPGIVGTLTAKDQAVLLAFSRTAAFARIQKIGPQVQELQVAWMRDVSPEDYAEVRDAMKTVLDARLAADKGPTP